MNFYEQYTTVCSQNGLEPCSQKAAELFGVTRATISSWKTKNTMPKGETVAIMANALHVSADYLLCRTSDPTDYSSQKQEAHTDAVQDDIPRILDLYSQLDTSDRIRVEAYMEGMLTNKKYF